MGWVLNPEDLVIGDQMYNPITNSWVTIQDLNYLYGNFKVYDVQTSPFNNYIANGILLDMKTH